MYLDDELIDIEYLCCLAHARAKLERAERQDRKEATCLMSLIRMPYRREDLYLDKGYSAEQKRKCVTMPIQIILLTISKMRCTI